MKNSVDFEQSLSKGRRAFQYMLNHHLPLTPQNYELWYHYVSSHNRKVVDAINGSIQDTGRLSPEAADKIYATHFDAEIELNSIDEMGAKVGREIEQVVGLLDEATGKNSEYTESLDDVSAQLGSNVDGGTLTRLVELLIASTREMTENNRALESSLNESKQQISDLNLHLDTVRRESRMDQLTGVSNRKHFDEHIAATMEEARHTGEELCLLVADIDFFKKFNDTYGHQTGDQVLRLVAGAMRSNVRASDFVARYGGEEFAVVLLSASLARAVEIANNVRDGVRAKEMVKKSTGETLGTLTISFGAAQYRVGESVESFIDRADQCLYAAKKGGRDMVKCETDSSIEFSAEVA